LKGDRTGATGKKLTNESWGRHHSDLCGVHFSARCLEGEKRGTITVRKKNKLLRLVLDAKRKKGKQQGKGVVPSSCSEPPGEGGGRTGDLYVRVEKGGRGKTQKGEKPFEKKHVTPTKKGELMRGGLGNHTSARTLTAGREKTLARNTENQNCEKKQDAWG